MVKTPYTVKVTIVGAQLAPCSQGYEVGRSWIVDSPTLPQDMCSAAWDVLNRVVLGLCYGIDRPFLHMKDKHTIIVSCPDQDRKVLYEARRIGENAETASGCQSVADA